MNPITSGIWTEKGNVAYAEPGGKWIDVKYIKVLISPTRFWLGVNLDKDTCTTRYNHYIPQLTLSLVLPVQGSSLQ